MCCTEGMLDILSVTLPIPSQKRVGVGGASNLAGDFMQRIVLTNARLLDGDKPARDKATIVIKGDRLERVVTGPWSDGNSTDQVYDLLGRTVMPGMVIGHYHATYTGYSAATVLPVGM